MVNIPVGGFMPIPLAMMIPFMATQSMIMGDAFGRAFQYGKRKISAMSNEEFNAYSSQKMSSDIFKTYEMAIPDIKQSIHMSQELQHFIVKEFIETAQRVITGTTEEFKDEDNPTGQNIVTNPFGETPYGGPRETGRRESRGLTGKKTIMNKNNPVWLKAIKAYTSAIEKGLVQQKRYGKDSVKGRAFGKGIISLMQQLNAFRLKFPASKYNYSNY